MLSRTPADNPVLLLVAGADAHASGWAARLAVRLATDLGTQGRRVVLADLGFDQPSLDSRMGVSNEEGMADVFMFGVSLAQVARQLPGQRFHFAPTGAFVGDPVEVLTHVRWGRVLDGFREAGATLIAYLPMTTPGAVALAERMDTVVGLASPQDLTAMRDAGDMSFSAVLRPAVAVGPAGSLEARRPTKARTRPLSAATPEPLTEPTFVQREAPRKRRTIAPVIALLMLFTIGFALWTFVGERFFGDGLTEAAQVTNASIVDPTPIERPLGYSVAIESHQTLDAAERRADALEREDPSTNFHVAPVPVYGRIWYSVFAGPLADSASAAQLLRRLVDAGVAEEAEEWAVRPTGWTYQIGEFPLRRAAERRAAELLDAGVPTYIVAVDYTAGPPRYRLYAGAYETLQEAEAMAGLLENAGVTGHSLRRRTGRTGE
ncbi:MAG TPA: SPOR domain-containing protein [Longimicrobiales bacterium]